MTHAMPSPTLLDGLIDAVQRAGDAILEVVARGFEASAKADKSPVTEADHAGETVILQALAVLAPGVPVVAEEECAAGRIPVVGARFFLVDALDGTREFVKGGQDYTVNIALVEDGAAVMGVVYAPALGRLFAGATGLGAFQSERGGARRPIRVRAPGAKLTVVASKSHGASANERYLATLPVGVRTNVGSSLKFALVAAGEADLYPRASPTSEWDTAAGQAVLEAAGGRMFAPDGSRFRYGKPGFLNTGFVATGLFDPPPIGPFLDAGSF